MKKLKYFIMTFIVFTLLFLATTVNAANVTYRDYDEINSLATKYSYGTLFFTDSTEIIPLSGRWINNAGYGDYIKNFGGTRGDTIKVKITNCAIDEDGDICDVIFTVDNIQDYGVITSSNSYKDYFPSITFSSSDVIYSHIGIHRKLQIADQSNPGGSVASQYDAFKTGDLILLNLSTTFARSDFTLEYFKAGTSNQANINGTIAIIYDIDIINGSSYNLSSSFLQGQEGLVPLLDGTVYYETTGQLQRYSDGIGVKSTAVNTNGLAKISSAFVTENTKAVYKMRYGGTGCGILYSFVSPYAYEVEAPKLTVDKTRVYEEEKFIYSASQYIPNNYYSGHLNFFTGYNGMYTNFKLEDTLDSHLYINGTPKVINETGTDVSSYFTITTNGNKVTATLKTSYLTSRDFYSHRYSLQIPAAFYYEAGKEVSSANNSASSTITAVGLNTVQNTNTVNTALKYDVKTTGRISNGTITVNGTSTTSNTTDTTTVNHGANSNITVTFKPDSIYKVSTVKVNGTAVALSSLTKNAAGEYTYTFTNNNVTNNIDQLIVVDTELIKTELSGSKFWDDESNKYYFRPGSYTLKLYADGVYVKSALFTGTTWRFEDLVKYNTTTKNEINYTVQEDEIILTPFDKYIPDIEGTTVTNRLVRTPSNVTVKYLDVYTNEVLAEQVELPGYVGDSYTTDEEEIAGYVLKETPANATGTYATTDTVVTYYYYKLSTLEIKHIDLNYNSNIVAPVYRKIKQGDAYTTSALTDTSYRLISTPANANGTMGRDTISVVYGYKKISAGVDVKYIDQATGEEIATKVHQDGLEKDSFTSSEKTIAGYELVKRPATETVLMTVDKITLVYEYRLKSTVTTKHIDQLTGNEICASTTETYLQGDVYTTTPENVPGYTLVNSPVTVTGIVERDNITVTYEYRKVSSGVEVQYIDQATGNYISNSIIKTGVEGTPYESYAKEIPGYELVKTPTNANGQMTVDKIVVRYEYRFIVYLTVNHEDEVTRAQLKNSVTTKHLQGDTYNTSKENFTGYTYTRVDGIPNGTFERQSIVVTYFYKKNTNVIVKYVDMLDGDREISTQTTINGIQGQAYTTTPKEITGYEYIRSVGRTSGNMSDTTIEVVYKYKKLVKLTTEHIDVDTGVKIATGVVNTYKEGDAYEALPQNISGYVMVEEPEEKTGIMGRENLVKTYKYKKVSQGLVVKYVDVKTNELLDEKVYTGNVGDTIELTTKSFMYYLLYSKPDFSTIDLTAGEQEVIFYYIKSIKMDVVGIEEGTGTELFRTTIEGPEGDPYDESDKKDLSGYELVEMPANAKGFFNRNDREIVFVYKKPEVKIEASVLARYIDEDTNELLDSETTYAYVGEPYRTTRKAFENYELVRIEGDEYGTMEETQKVVTYVYRKKTGRVIVTYIDEENNVIDSEELIGKVGENYQVNVKEIEGYEVVEIPVNVNGTYEEDIIEVVIKLQKIKVAPAEKGTIIIKFVDSKGNVLLERVVKSGEVGELLNFKAPQIDGYRAVVNSNIKAEFKNGELVFDVVYEKIQDEKPPVVGPEVTPENPEKPVTPQEPTVEEPKDDVSTGDINVILFAIVFAVCIIGISRAKKEIKA